MLVALAPLELLPTLVTPADAKLVPVFVVAAAVSGATISRIEEVMLKDDSDDVMMGAEVLLVEDAVVETAVLVGQVRRAFESVSRATARK